ncbi:MAG TPA: ABC transporter substrate-binding protein [Caldimonas sp.]
MRGWGAILLGSILCVASVHASAQAQQAGRTYRVGFLAMGSPAVTEPMLGHFRKAMSELGYLEGRNLVIEQRWTDGTTERLPELASQLVAAKVDLILAWGTPPVGAAKQVTKTTPVVMVGVADPIGAGFVPSLARPGGNLTGVTNIASDHSGKILELLTQVVPKVRTVAVLRNSGNAAHGSLLQDVETAARSHQVQLQVFAASRPDELDAAFASIARAKVEAVVFLADPMFFGQRDRIAELALRYHLPTGFARRENVDAGGLLAYGPSLSQQIGRAATFVDRILRGARPSDLPIEQPTHLELIINLRTAKALALIIPQSVLIGADEVIQ